MLYLEEHREIGDSAEKVDKLTEAFEEYSGNAIADVDAARCLRSTGQDLISSHEVELSASLLPKCDELTRMADALESAVGRRREILRLSKAMHQQIKQASEWCKRGVDLLCVVPVDVTSTAATTTALSSVEKFIAEGDNLRKCVPVRWQ
ncbi:hypothetical protein AB6A40_007660 [Gnathostoma spinigerum]|uniref:Uncharacterized protein n=1 Tax=Gnathostoma spinigerum TaxID=75299 RepID=A0ABD6EU23_9BILA